MTTPFPFPPWAPDRRVQVVYASELGCILDCDLETGLTVTGEAPSNNDAILNLWLSQATTAAPRKLIIDGGTATNGLVIPTTGNVTIEFPSQSCGLFVLSGSNNPPITNAPVSGIQSNGNRTGALFVNQSASGKNITIRGGTINGNIGTSYPATNSTYSADLQNNIYGIVMFNVAGVTIERCKLINVPGFNLWFYGCTDIIVDGCNITSSTNEQDGVHLSGPNSSARITRNILNTGDDSIALNSPENQFVSASGGGAIANVTISDNVINHGTRAYGNGSTATVGGVVYHGNTGSAGGYVYLLGNGVTAAEAIQTLILSDGLFGANASAFIGIADYCGDIELSNHTWDSPTNANTLLLWLFSAGITVSSFTFRNFNLYRTSRGNALAGAIGSTGASNVIGRLEFCGFAVVNEGGENYDPIPFLINMADLTITELVINSLDPTNITALMYNNDFTGVTISGPGVLATGFEIPDSAMANNCPYISATGGNAGKPCIKIGGTVYAFTIAS